MTMPQERVTRCSVNTALLDDWRLERKMSISEFCKIAELTRCAYYQYRKGISPSLEVRKRSSFLTSISEDILFNRTGVSQKGRTPYKKLFTHIRGSIQ